MKMSDGYSKNTKNCDGIKSYKSTDVSRLGIVVRQFWTRRGELSPIVGPFVRLHQDLNRDDAFDLDQRVEYDDDTAV